jgi:flagellar motor switch protein FliG
VRWQNRTRPRSRTSFATGSTTAQAEKAPTMAGAMDEVGLESAAILLMSLGEEEASGVLKHLAPKEVQRLGETISRMKAVTRERVDGVMDQFDALSGSESLLVADKDAYVKSMLRKALGEDKAALLIDRIMQGSDVADIENLKWMDPQAVAELLRNEHAQIAAAILVHLESDQASEVLKLFTERQRNEVMVRIATLDGIQPHALRDLNEVMSKVLAGGGITRKASLGGVKAAAEILNMLGTPAETSVLDFVRETDSDLAQQLMDNMFTFDDVENVDDKGIQALLKEVQSESLVIALKGATPALREKVFRNMSSRAAETLREDLESRGPVRLSEVEAEQKELLKVVRRLVEEGQIVLSSGGGDDQFV